MTSTPIVGRLAPFLFYVLAVAGASVSTWLVCQSLAVQFGIPDGYPFLALAGAVGVFELVKLLVSERAGSFLRHGRYAASFVALLIFLSMAVVTVLMSATTVDRMDQAEVNAARAVVHAYDKWRASRAVDEERLAIAARELAKLHGEREVREVRELINKYTINYSCPYTGRWKERAEGCATLAMLKLELPRAEKKAELEVVVARLKQVLLVASPRPPTPAELDLVEGSNTRVLEGTNTRVLEGGVSAGVSAAFTWVLEHKNTLALEGLVVLAAIMAQVLLFIEKNGSAHPGVVSGVSAGVSADLHPGVVSGVVSGVSAGVSADLHPGVSAGVDADLHPGVSAGVSPPDEAGEDPEGEVDLVVILQKQHKGSWTGTWGALAALMGCSVNAAKRRVEQLSRAKVITVQAKRGIGITVRTLAA